MTVHRPIVLINGELSQLPVGDTVVGGSSDIPLYSSILASEYLSAGDFVNVFKVDDITKVRKAYGIGGDHEAHGFVLEAFTADSLAKVYFEGINTSVQGVGLGPVWISTLTPGVAQSSPATSGGQLNQQLGVALTSESISFQPGLPVLLA